MYMYMCINVCMCTFNQCTHDYHVIYGIVGDHTDATGMEEEYYDEDEGVEDQVLSECWTCTHIMYMYICIV